MTFFHFLNCVTLAGAPHVIVYKASGLSEYGAYWKCIQAGIAYFLTQFCKMLVLATFFPERETSGDAFDFVGEFLKTTADVVDLLGMYMIMTQIAAKGSQKFAIAGIGWASAELLMTRFLPFWIGARGTEFEWRYVQMSLESNVNLIQTLAEATLVWLYTRHDLSRSLRPVTALLLAVCCYRPFILQLVTFGTGIGAWTLLAVELFSTAVTGLLALRMYHSLAIAVNAH